jgi:hypothetical protein
VHLFDRSGRNHRRKAPSNIFNKPDFYTVFKGEERDLRIEHSLGDIENDFIRTRRSLEAGNGLTMRQTASFYSFVGAMMVRTPRHIDFKTSQYEALVKFAEGITIRPDATRIKHLPTGGPSITLDEMRELAKDPMGTWFPPETNVHIDTLVELFGCDVLVNDSDTPFITSDAPAAIYHVGESRMMPRGLGAEDCEITLPISPSMALLFRHKKRSGHGFIVADDGCVLEVNFRTILRANEEIVSDREDIYFIKIMAQGIVDLEAQPDDLSP